MSKETHGISGPCGSIANIDEDAHSNRRVDHLDAQRRSQGATESQSPRTATALSTAPQVGRNGGRTIHARASLPESLLQQYQAHEDVASAENARISDRRRDGDQDGLMEIPPPSIPSRAQSHMLYQTDTPLLHPLILQADGDMHELGAHLNLSQDRSTRTDEDPQQVCSTSVSDIINDVLKMLDEDQDQWRFDA